MVYTPQTWADGSGGNTPITAARLTHLEQGLVALDAALSVGLANLGTVQTNLGTVTTNLGTVTSGLAATNASLTGRPQMVAVTTGNEARPTGSTSVIWLVTNEAITTITNANATNDLVIRPADVSGAPADTTAPSVPTGVTSSAISPTGFQLNWTASTDDVAVTGYDVQLDGVSVATPATNAASISGRSPSTLYSVRVRARDAAGNWSGLSTAINVTTGAGADVTAPTVPTGLAGSAQTSTGFQLNWTASTDAVGVTGYEVYLDGGAIATPATNSYTVTGRTASTTYAVQVRARDAAGNWSALSSSINVSTTAGADTTAPSVPTGVAASAITTTGFQLNWTASTDAVGVTGYEVFLNGVSVATPATNDYTVTGRTAGTLYAVTVRARDAVPNWSAQSSPAVNVTTTSAGGTAKHSIWGASAPAGTWTANTDGTPNIEVGNGFYRYGTGTGTYPNMRLVGGKVFKPTGITLPTGTVTMRWYVNTGGLPLPCPASGWGTMTASKTVSMAFVDGWNEILLDTPIAMPPNAGLVVITVQWNGNDDFYLANTGAKPNSDFLAANDGTKLAWSDTTTSSGLISAGFKIGTTYGVTGPAGLSYGTDIVVDEGP